MKKEEVSEYGSIGVSESGKQSDNGQPIRQAQGGRTTHSTDSTGSLQASSGQAGHGPICQKCKSHNTEKRGNSIKCLDCGAEVLNV